MVYFFQYYMGGVTMRGIAKASFILSIVTVCVGAAAIVLNAIQLNSEY